MPYIYIVVVTMVLIYVFPGIVTWLPEYLSGNSGAPAGIMVDSPPVGGFIEETIGELPPLR